MAEQVPFPKTLFSKDEQQNPVTDSVSGEVLCGSRAFASQAEVDAAGGNAVWKATPQEASQAQEPPQRQTGVQQPSTGRQPLPSQQPVRPPHPEPEPDDEDEGGVATPTVPRRR